VRASFTLFLGWILTVALRSSPLGVLVLNILSEEVWDVSREVSSSNLKFRFFLEKSGSEPIFCGLI
jgi:hypothetical protein